MTDQPNSYPPPGWYPDPEAPERQRWWDGKAWGSQLSTDPAFAAAASGTPGQMRPAGEWFGAALRLAQSRAGHFLPMIALLVIPFTLAGAAAIWVAVVDGEVRISAAADSISAEGLNVGALIAAGVIQLVAVVVGIALFGAITHQARAAEKDEPVGWSESLKAAFSRLPALIVASFGRSLIIGAVVLIGLGLCSGIASLGPLGALLAVLGFISLPFVVIALWTRLCLVPTAAMFGEGEGSVLTRSLRASWTRTSGRFWATFGRMLLLALFWIGVLFLVNLISGILGAGASGPAEWPVSGEPYVLRFVDYLPSNLGFYGVAAVLAAIGAGIRQVLIAVGSLLLWDDLGSGNSD